MRFLPPEPQSCPSWLHASDFDDEPTAGSFTVLLVEGFDQLVKSDSQVTQLCVQSNFMLPASTWQIECLMLYVQGKMELQSDFASLIVKLPYLCLCAFHDMWMCCINA